VNLGMFIQKSEVRHGPLDELGRDELKALAEGLAGMKPIGGGSDTTH
jgi:hypothetical protein